MTTDFSTYIPPSLRYKEAAAFLGTSPASLWRWTRAGEGPPSYKIGKNRLWRESDLADWLEDSCRQTRAAV